jgi:hypothetical protein
LESWVLFVLIQFDARYKSKANISPNMNKPNIQLFKYYILGILSQPIPSPDTEAESYLFQQIAQKAFELELDEMELESILLGFEFDDEDLQEL